MLKSHGIRVNFTCTSEKYSVFFQLMILWVKMTKQFLQLGSCVNITALQIMHLLICALFPKASSVQWIQLLIQHMDYAFQNRLLFLFLKIQHLLFHALIYFQSRLYTSTLYSCLFLIGIVPTHLSLLLCELSSAPHNSSDLKGGRPHVRLIS